MTRPNIRFATKNIISRFHISATHQSILKNLLIVTPVSLMSRGGMLLIYAVLANWFGVNPEMDFLYYYWGIAIFLTPDPEFSFRIFGTDSDASGGTREKSRRCKCVSASNLFGLSNRHAQHLLCVIFQHLLFCFKPLPTAPEHPRQPRHWYSLWTCDFHDICFDSVDIQSRLGCLSALQFAGDCPSTRCTCRHRANLRV